MQVTNPSVFDYSLNEDLDVGFSCFISLVILDTGGPGGFRTNTFDARHIIGNVRIIDRQMGSRVYEGKAVVMKVPVHIGNKPQKTLFSIDAVARDCEEDGGEGVVDADKIVIGGLSNDGEEGCFGVSEG